MRSTLFKKYALIFGAVVGSLLLLSGVLGISYSYQHNRQALTELQHEKAQASAVQIGQRLVDLEQKIGTTAEPKAGVKPLEQRRAEVELLRRTQAFKEVALLDPDGREVLRVSRRGGERDNSRTDFSTQPWFAQVQSGRPYRSPVYFDGDALFMTVAMAVGPEEAGITVAEIDLEFLLGSISSIKVGSAGHAYAVDSNGLLIAHPNIGLVLQKKSLSTLPQVQAALRAPDHGNVDLSAARNQAGEPVLTAYGTIPYLGWLVFVEEPLTQAYQPLYAEAARSVMLMLLGIVLTVLACVTLVRQMVKPIRALRDGAQQIGRGVFDQPIVVKTGDELEELADDFNNMAQRLQESYASLEQKVAQRTRELTDTTHALREAQQIAGLGSYMFDVASNSWVGADVLDSLLGIDTNTPRVHKSFTELIHPDDLQTFRTSVENQLLAQGHTFNTVFRIIRLNDQAVRWVHGLGKAEYGDAGTVIKVTGTIQDITERKELEDQIRQLAFYDALTQLPNRRLFHDRLSQALLAEKRSGNCGAVMFLDLDNFKPLNDLHGHAAGDLLLVEVARRLQTCVRKADTVARFGGDEFVAILTELHGEREQAGLQAMAVAEKVRLSLSEPYRLVVHSEAKDDVTIEHHCSASIGVTLFGPLDANETDILVAADAAMYEAKKAGRNAIRMNLQ
jgi:diguanylate cyclase (GGDEF)-like protein